MNVTSFTDFEEIIGYHYKDITLLENALRHSSYSNEMHLPKTACNERLEFLGDAVLELISSDFLFHLYPDYPEGDLTRLRASMVCEPPLAFCAREIQLGKYILLGKGEEATGGRERDSVLSDALEAVIGSIFLDSGIEEAKTFILRFILNDLENKRLFFDSKTVLQEIVQKHFGCNITYEVVEESGPAHAKQFITRVLLNGRELARGSGKSKKNAEQNAAFASIRKLEEDGYRN